MPAAWISTILLTRPARDVIRTEGLLGFSIGLAAVAVLVLLRRRLVRPEWLANSLIALMLLGVPMQLGLERSNIDLVVFVLLCSLAAISQLLQRRPSKPRHRPWHEGPSNAAAALASPGLPPT